MFRQISSAEEFFIDVILQRHARQLLQATKLQELGYMSAALDFHLVGWLGREKERAARIEDFVGVLKQLHEELNWPKPSIDSNFKKNNKKSNLLYHLEKACNFIENYLFFFSHSTTRISKYIITF